MNQQIAYLSQLKQTMELYQFMVKLCWLKTLLDGQVKEKSASGAEKIEAKPCREKSPRKSLSRQEKTEVSTIAASEVIKGRMYDFNNGRFLSVDPFIQGVTSQAINPYSYIQNNPLSGTDPTGYIIEGDKPCESDDYACQWDQSISNVTGVPRDKITQHYNGLRSNNSDSNDYISDFNSESDKYLQQWLDRDPSQMIADDFALSQSHPWLFSDASHSAYFDPPLLFKWIGDPIAGWRDDRMNPITNEVLTPREAFDARFFSIIDLGSLGLGKTVSTAKYTDDFFANLANMQNKFEDLAENFLLPKYKELDPMLEAGFTGSLRTGYVGNPNKSTYGNHIDFDSFDIDYYINSNRLHQSFGNSLKADVEFRKVLSNTPGFEGLRANKQGFSIKFNPKE